jgi:hypothetical protein
VGATDADKEQGVVPELVSIRELDFVEFEECSLEGAEVLDDCGQRTEQANVATTASIQERKLGRVVRILGTRSLKKTKAQRRKV